MAEDAGGEFGEEIDVFVAVGVPQMRAVALDHRQRERLGIDRRPRVAAGQSGAGFLVQLKAFRVARAVLLLRLGQRRGKVDVGGVARAHRLSSVAAPGLARSGAAWRGSQPPIPCSREIFLGAALSRNKWLIGRNS